MSRYEMLVLVVSLVVLAWGIVLGVLYRRDLMTSRRYDLLVFSSFVIVMSGLLALFMRAEHIKAWLNSW